ncbi:MAG: MinD/ParA family protein [Chlamydiia bacterium]|jgi:MinD-like ATPase involved in chromosome partitioning or flagellar assembly|nr:MinD/ParA family protein [Chlamydiia bacterium]
MGKNVIFHSFQGGVGKTTIISNLAIELAKQGKKIAVLDFDLYSPSLDVSFGIQKKKIHNTINDFLKKEIDIQDVSIEIIENHLYLFPCSLNSLDLLEIARDGYDTHKFILLVNLIMENLKLDFLFIDTPAGINEDALLATSIADELILVLKPDKHQIEGSRILLEFVHKINSCKIGIIVNKCQTQYSRESIPKEIETQLKTSILACLSYSEKLREQENNGIFIEKNPDDPLSKELQNLSKLL